MPDPVFVATRTDLPAIQAVMDLGFAQDPTVLWVSDRRDVFEAEHHRYVALCADPAFDHGGVHATEGFSSAAIWYPPGIEVSDTAWAAFRSSAFFPEKIDGLSALAEACDSFRPTGPHWTLELIAVDPSAQNRGIGGQLMRFGLQISDRTGLPVFLASSNPANLPFYERHGFRICGDVRNKGLPEMFPMVRDAGG